MIDGREQSKSEVHQKLFSFSVMVACSFVLEKIKLRRIVQDCDQQQIKTWLSKAWYGYNYRYIDEKREALVCFSEAKYLANSVILKRSKPTTTLIQVCSMQRMISLLGLNSFPIVESESRTASVADPSGSNRRRQFVKMILDVYVI